MAIMRDDEAILREIIEQSEHPLDEQIAQAKVFVEMLCSMHPNAIVRKKARRLVKAMQ
jgi:hypothetical protein